MRTPYLSLVALLLGLAETSCSLVVNDLTPGRCLSFEDCAALNDRDGLDALSCELWTCDVGSTECVRRPRDHDGDGSFGPYPARSACTYPVTDCNDGDPNRSPNQTEICDGIDNDCDLAIDETTDPTRPLATEGVSSGPFPAGDLGDPSRIAFPSSQEPSARDAVISTRRAGTVDGRHITLGASGATGLTWQAWCGGPTPEGFCPTVAMCVPSGQSCDFGAAAVDAVGTATWIAAGGAVICASGDVRVGVLAGATASVSTAGDAFAGVPACADGPASRPALATLQAAGLQLALVAHVAEAPASARACGSGSVMVRAAAVRLVDATDGEVRTFGPMLDLAPTSATSAPTIAAVGSSGWVVGFGGASGGADLFWIPADAASATKIATVGTGPTGEVRLAAGMSTAVVALGVLRQAGCGSGTIVYQTVHFAPTDPAGTFATSAPVTLEASGRGPSLVHVERGLVVEGYARDLTPPVTGPVATTEQTGGWIAVWSDVDAQGDSWARRILAFDDQPLGDRDRVSDAAGTATWVARAPAGVGQPLLDAYVFGDDTLVHSVALYCATH